MTDQINQEAKSELQEKIEKEMKAKYEKMFQERVQGFEENK